MDKNIQAVSINFWTTSKNFVWFCFVFFAFIVKHCSGNRWVHVVLQYKNKNKSSKFVDLHQDSQSQSPEPLPECQGFLGERGKKDVKRGDSKGKETSSLSPPSPLYNFLFPTLWERPNTQTSDEDMPPSIVCNENFSPLHSLFRVFFSKGN